MLWLKLECCDCCVIKLNSIAEQTDHSLHLPAICGSIFFFLLLNLKHFRGCGSLVWIKLIGIVNGKKNDGFCVYVECDHTNLILQMVCFTNPSGKEPGETLGKRTALSKRNTQKAIGRTICLSWLTSTNQLPPVKLVAKSNYYHCQLRENIFSTENRWQLIIRMWW